MHFQTMNSDIGPIPFLICQLCQYNKILFNVAPNLGAILSKNSDSIICFFCFKYLIIVKRIFFRIQPEACLFNNVFRLPSFSFITFFQVCYSLSYNYLHSSWTFCILKDLCKHNITIFLCRLHTILFGVSLFQDW